MILDEKFAPIRKGLLEFILLKIIAAEKGVCGGGHPKTAQHHGICHPGRDLISALLSKMRREELLDYDWKESEAGPPRKYYELTAKGREQLRETADYWQKINETVSRLGPA